MTLPLSNKKHIFNLMFLTFVIFLLYFIFYKDLNFFLLLIFIVKSLMGLVVMTIAINTYKISQNTILTFLAITLGFCSIIDFLSVMFNYHYEGSSILSNHIYLQIFVDFLNIFSLILCFNLYNKTVNFRHVFIFYSTIILAFVLLFILFLFVLNLFPSIYEVVFFNFTVKYILNFILFIFSLYPIYIFTRIKKNNYYNELYSIFSLSILFTFAMLSFILSSKGDSVNTFSFIGNILTLFYSFFLCRIIITAVLRKPYDVLFGNLSNKSQELKKLNIYYETLIESLPLSIIVLNNNIIKFVNSSTLELATVPIIIPPGITPDLPSVSIVSPLLT